MLIVPAIDVMAGRVVRLEQGDFNRPIFYDRPALAYAETWTLQGARFLHVVDLDGAKTGEPVNFSLITDIAKSKGVKIEVGGGIRNVGIIRKYLEAGVERVVLSTRVLEDASFLLCCDIRRYLDKVVVSIDIKDLTMNALTTGTAGWTKAGDVTIDLKEFIKTLSDAGISYINFSDISKDGMLGGVDVEKIARFLVLAREAAQKKLFFTYAGGISSLEDIRKLKSLGREGVDAVIVGRALYENKFNVTEAIRAAQ